jgi:hypothetical protein
MTVPAAEPVSANTGDQMVGGVEELRRELRAER